MELSGENVAARIAAVWPSRVAKHLPATALQRLPSWLEHTVRRVVLSADSSTINWMTEIFAALSIRYAVCYVLNVVTVIFKQLYKIMSCVLTSVYKMYIYKVVTILIQRPLNIFLIVVCVVFCVVIIVFHSTRKMKYVVQTSWKNQ